MRIDAKRIGFLLLTLAVVGCGGSITGNGPMTGQGGQGGSTTTIPCAAMGQCDCWAASDRCAVQTEACWCPSECNAAIDCICGGGRFLACQDKNVVLPCTNQLAAVQAKCADQPFVQYIADVCSLSAITPTCVAACLANLNVLGSCAEIDCSFCPVCDCAPSATPSPFAACVQACYAPPPPERL